MISYTGVGVSARIGFKFSDAMRMPGIRRDLFMRRCSLVYAIIKTGGKQYMVKAGDVLTVEKLDAESGEKVVFEEVLAVGDNGELQVGNPVVAGAKVEGTVVGNGKAKKVIVFKYKPKKDYRRKQGHRQPFTKVKIEKINA